MSKDKLLESIKLMIPNGNRLELPKDVKFSNYAQVKKTLLTAGSKYKKCGFEFKEDAATVQQRLLGGEAINDKKKFQFFATPEKLAKRLVEMADIMYSDYCLEPSAGQGGISDLMINRGGSTVVVELMPENVLVLNGKGYLVHDTDFLSIEVGDFKPFDKIVANPPFTKNQDIDHVIHMYAMLKDGGRLVSVMSKSWTFGTQKKQIAFRKWLDEIGAHIEEIDAGEFQESGTNISSMIVQIDK